MSEKDDDQYAGLSPEEVEALKEEDADATSLEAIAADDDDDDGEEEVVSKDAKADAKDDGEPDDAKAEAEGDAEGEAEAEAKGDDDGGDGDDDRATDVPFSAYMEVDRPENLDDRIKELEAKREELDSQFNDSEMEFVDYRKADREVQRELNDLVRQQERANEAEAYNSNLDRQRWLWEVNRYVDDVRERDGIDYEKDETLRARLDTAVRMVAQDPETKGWSGRRILQEADSWVRARTGAAAKPASDGGKEGGKEVKKAGRKADLSVVPQTLANVPPADVGEVGERETKWDRLDKLAEKDSLALEKELAKLSPEDQAAYLQSA